MTDELAVNATYGTAEHAAREALNASIYSSDGYVSAFAGDVADAVVAGLRERGFTVTRGPHCECGWTGVANHMHDMRMGKAKRDE